MYLISVMKMKTIFCLITGIICSCIIAGINGYTEDTTHKQTGVGTEKNNLQMGIQSLLYKTKLGRLKIRSLAMLVNNNEDVDAYYKSFTKEYLLDILRGMDRKVIDLYDEDKHCLQQKYEDLGPKHQLQAIHRTTHTLNQYLTKLDLIQIRLITDMTERHKLKSGTLTRTTVGKAASNYEVSDKVNLDVSVHETKNKNRHDSKRNHVTVEKRRTEEKSHVKHNVETNDGQSQKYKPEKVKLENILTQEEEESIDPTKKEPKTNVIILPEGNPIGMDADRHASVSHKDDETRSTDTIRKSYDHVQTSRKKEKKSLEELPDQNVYQRMQRLAVPVYDKLHEIGYDSYNKIKTSLSKAYTKMEKRNVDKTKLILILAVVLLSLLLVILIICFTFYWVRNRKKRKRKQVAKKVPSKVQDMESKIGNWDLSEKDHSRSSNDSRYCENSSVHGHRIQRMRGSYVSVMTNEIQDEYYLIRLLENMQLDFTTEHQGTVKKDESQNSTSMSTIHQSEIDPDDSMSQQYIYMDP